MRGPSDVGLLLGQKRFIEAVIANTSPNEGTIGRALKVGKEDTIAMLRAFELYLERDHQAEWQEWERRIAFIENSLNDIPGLELERIVPPISNEVPHLLIDWDEKQISLTPEKVKKLLAEGDPSIEIDRVDGTGDRGILISVFTLEEGEEKKVAMRLGEIFRGTHSNQ